ncbi:MAG: transcriptional regulator [Methanobrevibacter sp.]|uniref:Transcriptional regulator n=1 Tax=Methanobrevibacter millerae TaxID=230361 RepID=A0A8T3VJ36_9EURY|nr:transcriptional regulator [Methanobrevibacter millerae]MBE6504154.1 transcriptional regulator [Methanobrevibacter millerae]MBR0370022.1 transcriptional regulator [Methanobrevibacter sp.]
MEEKELLDIVGYVMASTYRLGVLQYIGNGVKIPSDIARTIGVRTNHISNVLSDLKENGLVVCLNENAHKGRLYKNTELSLEILKYLKEMND